MNSTKVRIELMNSEIIDGTLQNDVDLAYFIDATVSEDGAISHEIIIEIPMSLIEKHKEFVTLIEGVVFELSANITDNLKTQLHDEGEQLQYTLSDIDDSFNDQLTWNMTDDDDNSTDHS
tara:strand:- start:265 stop:624 length:360 start_codon:yes stop_codon:yes gene_type:complete